MKYLILFTILTGYSLISHSQTENLTNIDKLIWLEGTWNRTNTKANRSAHERWIKKSNSELVGYGVTMNGTDTVFLEKLKIILKGRNLFYVADVPENKQPVYFKLTELSADGFTCENPQHDFPKKISYYKEGNKLKATTSGNGKSIDYIFVKED